MKLREILIVQSEKHFERGVNLFRKGRYEDAIIEFNRVLKFNPKNELALFYLGLIHTEVGKQDIAENYLESALNLDPNLVGCYLILGIIYAEKWLEKIDNNTIFLDKAIDCYKKVTELNSEDVESREFLEQLNLYKRG